MSMFRKLKNDPENLDIVYDIVKHYEDELCEAEKDVRISNNTVKECTNLPGIVAYRYSQLQELEAILEFLHNRMRQIKGERLRHYLEKYDRSMSLREAEKYAEADDAVIFLYDLINEISHVRNRFLGIMKALDSKNFQLNNITKLKCAGFDDV